MQRILIIGAGPCGLACARELERLGHHDWQVFESAAQAGGLASSLLDGSGFTWDLGGHVVFSHFGEFDALLEDAMGDDVISHDRSSFIRFDDRWVPYPFQNNLRYLPEGPREECLEGLAQAPGPRPGMDFQTWIQAVFGAGITRHFMAPYNRKVWATPLEDLSSDWIAERVAVVDYERALRNVREQRDDLGWGPNNRFRFPVRGGTGEIYRRLASGLGARIAYGCEIVQVDPVHRRVRLRSGEEEAYDALISTMPLDRLVSIVSDVPPAVREASRSLSHTSVYMVGVGYEAPLTDTKSWMYFPQAEVPFYRVTNFAKYAAANVPGGNTERYSSFMTEVAHSRHSPVSPNGLSERVESALRGVRLVEGRPRVASLHLEEIEYAYPVPTRGRDRALAVIQPWLMEHDILSRGRFGSWMYEIGNMDHAVKMGIDVVRHLLGEGTEEIWSVRQA